MSDTLKKMVVTVATGYRRNTGNPGEDHLLGVSFASKLPRFVGMFKSFGCRSDEILVWDETLPPDSPTQEDKPYAFKAYALKAAVKAGAELILWADVSVYPVADFSSIWEIMELNGAFFIANSSGSCGEWTCDSALGPLGITRGEAFGIPQVVGTLFGLNVKHSRGLKIYEEFCRLAETDAFKGPWVNDKGQASNDKRVRGHRHDQTALSVVAYRNGVPLFPQFPYLGEPQDPEWRKLMFFVGR